jgi:DNA-binding NarL/FixJ family response regulator
MNPISVLFVDDHQIVRKGLRSILDPDLRFSVVGEAATGAEALYGVRKYQPDIVILDLRLPDMTGVEACQRILKSFPETIVLILTAYFERDTVFACLRAGAKGYLIKDAEQLNLPEQLLSVYQGHTILDPRATDALTEYIQDSTQPTNPLSLREIEVIQLISQGLTNREVAIHLQLTENTIKGYVKEIFTRLGARNRIEAVALARKRGIL